MNPLDRLAAIPLPDISYDPEAQKAARAEWRDSCNAIVAEFLSELIGRPVPVSRRRSRYQIARSFASVATTNAAGVAPECSGLGYRAVKP